MGNTNIDKNTMGYLGEDFQFQLVKCFMEEDKYFGELNPIVNPNAFTQPLLRIFVGRLQEYYERYGSVPSYEMMKPILFEHCNSDMERGEWMNLIDKMRTAPYEGREFYRDRGLRFFKQQNLVKVANKIIELAKDGDLDRYDECQRLFEEGNILSDEDSMPISPYELMNAALAPDFKRPIPTGISKLDEALNGGLEKGKMGLIIGSAGFGKSTLCTAIASHACSAKSVLNNYEGWKVLQIYFEDDDVDITRKHFSRISGVEARNLTKDPITTEEVRRALDNYPDKEAVIKNLRIKKMPTGKKSATDIENYIKKVINKGFRPDMVMLDYFECLKAEKGGFQSDSEWNRQGVTMRRLENMAKDLNIALWIPTQGNKGSITNKDVVTMDQAGGSIIKVQVAQVVISIARTLEDIDNNRATIAILKNRSGKSGVVLQNILFNNGTSTVSCEETIQYDSAVAYKTHVAEAQQQYDEMVKQQTLRSMQQNPQQQDFANNMFENTYAMPEGLNGLPGPNGVVMPSYDELGNMSYDQYGNTTKY